MSLPLLLLDQQNDVYAITGFVPTALQVVRVSHNDSEINIYPIGDFLDNTFYQLSSTNPVSWTGPIRLRTAENVTFLYCQLNSTFFIGKFGYTE